MNNEIIVVKQLPVIQEQLQQIKAQVTARVENALSLVCDENSVKIVKEERASLNKELKYWEEKRKEVKKAVLSPYEQFEAVYKECISDNYKKADVELKAKIDSVENGLKKEKVAEVRAYFDEYRDSKIYDGVKWIVFENANINVTLSASMKSLKAQAAEFIDRICDDLNLIDTQEHKDEILFHYKKIDGFSFLNASKSITFVAEKYKAIELEKEKEAERQAKAEAEKKAAEKVDTVVETLTPPTDEPFTLAPPVEKEKIVQTTFTLKGTKTQLKEVKDFIIKKGIEIV